MEFEKQLKKRERESEDQIIVKESIIKTDKFTGLIEKSIISNIKSKALFLIRHQFENVNLNEIIENVKEHISIGTDYHLVESEQFITIYYDQKTRKSCN